MATGFICWNPFQVFHMYSICKNIDGGILLLLKKKNIEFDRLFSEEFLENLSVPYIIISRKDIVQLDGNIDALVCPNPFPGIEGIKKTFIIWMQYSMAKELYQYNDWNYLFDLRLVYGEYTAERVAKYGCVKKVGNPRYDSWFAKLLDIEKLKKFKENLNPNKKTILYLPTWGEFSSIKVFGRKIAELKNEYNLLLKIHHKSDCNELNIIQGNLEKFGNKFFSGDDIQYLLSSADLVLSDYSGAIFDAIYLNKPVMLLQKDPSSLVGEKFDFESIEYAERENIGPVVTDPNNLKEKVEEYLKDLDSFRYKNLELKKRTFSYEGNSGYIAAKAIEEFIDKPLRNRLDILIRDEAKKERKKSIYKKKLISKEKLKNKINQKIKKLIYLSIKKLKTYLSRINS